jgi:hypothetical protein
MGPLYVHFEEKLRVLSFSFSIFQIRDKSSNSRLIDTDEIILFNTHILGGMHNGTVKLQNRIQLLKTK